MNQRESFLRRHALGIGLALMFLLTWPIELSYSGLLPFHVPFIVWLFMGWGIFAASVLVTWLILGLPAVGALLKRFLIWRVGWKWYLAVLVIPGLAALGVVLYGLATGSAPDFSSAYANKIFGPSSNLLIFLAPFLLTDFISNGEEIGWRGYVLPRLQSRHGMLPSALIVGLIWGMWHLPKYLAHWDTLSFALLILDTVAKSVLLAWIYNGTRGSLFMTTLTHAAYNTAGAFLPVANTQSNSNIGPSLVIIALEMLVAVTVAVSSDRATIVRAAALQAHE